MVNGKQ